MNGHKDSSGKFHPHGNSKKNLSKLFDTSMHPNNSINKPTAGELEKQKVREKVIKMMKSGKLYSNFPDTVKNNIFMVDSSWSEPAQYQLAFSIAQDEAYEKFPDDRDSDGNYFSKREDLIEKLEVEYYKKMDSNPVDFLINEAKLGTSIKDLVDENILKLDVDDVVHDIMNGKSH